MLDERIHHIPYVPAKPEPYYEPTGRELRPRPVGEENGVIVYTYNPICAVNYVSWFLGWVVRFSGCFEKSHWGNYGTVSRTALEHIGTFHFKSLNL